MVGWGMAGRIEERLAELGIELPRAPAPAAAYVPYTRAGDLLFVAGQLPVHLGELRYVGRIGEEFSVEEGQAAARQCGVNLIAQVADALNGDLDRLVRVVKLGGFVSATPAFKDHPKVINGASELMIQVFGDIGRHARFAVGANSLPFGVCVEIDGIFQVR
jgi:enamine deaminase RidA (YjgF/YER057c/UK114 family)